MTSIYMSSIEYNTEYLIMIASYNCNDIAFFKGTHVEVRDKRLDK